MLFVHALVSTAVNINVNTSNPLPINLFPKIFFLTPCYNGLSLIQTPNRGPESVCNNGSWLYFPIDGMLVHHRVPSVKWLGVVLLPHGWDASPSQGPQHEMTRSITTFPWMGCSAITGYPAWNDKEYYYFALDGMLGHHRVPSMKWQGVLLLCPGWDASPSQGPQHEMTRSITTLPWMGC